MERLLSYLTRSSFVGAESGLLKALDLRTGLEHIIKLFKNLRQQALGRQHVPLPKICQCDQGKWMNFQWDDKIINFLQSWLFDTSF